MRLERVLEGGLLLLAFHVNSRAREYEYSVLHSCIFMMGLRCPIRLYKNNFRNSHNLRALFPKYINSGIIPLARPIRLSSNSRQNRAVVVFSEASFLGRFWLQTAAAADEVVPVVPPADPPQRAHLPPLQGQEPLQEPQEAQEEIVAPPERYAKLDSPLCIVYCVNLHCCMINMDMALDEYSYRVASSVPMKFPVWFKEFKGNSFFYGLKLQNPTELCANVTEKH